MKVAFVSASVSRRNGGVSEVKRRLAQNLVGLPNLEIQVFGLKDEHTTNDLPLWQPFRPQVHEIVGPWGFGFSKSLLPSLKKADADLIHLHGLWHYTSYAALKSSKPYITTVHGMLDSWAVKHSRVKKQIASLLYEKAALQGATCLQAITEQEVKDIRDFGLRNPVCMIPNGVDLPENLAQLKAMDPVWKGQIEPGKKVMLYLGRIHPKKGLTNLVQSWKKLQQEQGAEAKNWHLVIAGWNQGTYEQELKDLARTAGVEASILFIGSQFNLQKQLTFAHADAFILPSFSEGLPMVILEAWAYGLPVIMTPQCNLPQGFAQGAALKVDPTVESVYRGLLDFFRLDDVAQKGMGALGLQLVATQFSWESVAAQIHQVYKWMLGQGERPPNILTK